MIYDSTSGRISLFIHSKPIRIFGLVLMFTACLFFAGRQGIVTEAKETTGKSSESFSDSDGSTEGFSEDGEEEDSADNEEESVKESTENEDNPEEIQDNPDDGSEQITDDPELVEDTGEDIEDEEEDGEDTGDDEEEAAAKSQAGTPVRIILSGEKRFKAGNYFFHANKNFDTLYYSESDNDEGNVLLQGDSFVSTFVTDGKDIYYFTSKGLEKYSIDNKKADLVMSMETGELVTPYIVQVYEGKYYYTVYKSDTNSVFYCYNTADGKVSTIAEDRLAPNLYSGAEGQYLLLMSTDFSKTYLYDCSTGQTHEIGQGTVNASFWNGKLYVSQIDNYEGGSAHLKACNLPDLKVVKAITIGENIMTNSFADGYFYYSYGKMDDKGNLKEEHFVQINPLTGEQRSVSKKECNLALYNQENPGAE